MGAEMTSLSLRLASETLSRLRMLLNRKSVLVHADTLEKKHKSTTPECRAGNDEWQVK